MQTISSRKGLDHDRSPVTSVVDLVVGRDTSGDDVIEDNVADDQGHWGDSGTEGRISDEGDRVPRPSCHETDIRLAVLIEADGEAALVAISLDHG